MSIDVNSSYLAAVRDSVGSHIFRHLYAVDEHGSRSDILQNGRLSCAYYVAFILYHFQLVKTPHATVTSTEPSDAHAEGAMHEHIGFYLGDERAISNSSAIGEITEHDWTFGADNEGNPNRKITKILRRPAPSAPAK